MAQIGTVGVQTQNNGTVSVPVFDTADAGSDVYTMWRVQTASGIGFIPLVDPASASYNYLRVQTENQGVVAVHNEASLLQYSVVDSFADTDFSEWSTPSSTLTQWDNSTPTRPVTSPASEEYAAISSDGNSTVYSLPGDGLSTYMQRGRSIKTWLYMTSGNPGYPTKTGLLFGIENADSFSYSNGYAITMGQNNELNIEKESTVIQSSDTQPLGSDSWYQFEVTEYTTDGTIEAVARDTNLDTLATVSVSNETEFDNNGVGYLIEGNGDGTAYDGLYVDHLEIES